MIRFVHTADWQLGMTRRFLGAEAQARYDAARLAVIERVARVVEADGCAFVVVCGDVFESNHVDRQVVVRALDAMSAVRAPVYLLPGNHDPFDVSAVYASPTFSRARPANVFVLTGPEPVEPAAGVSLHPVPWDTRRPTHDLAARVVADVAAAADDASRPHRILVAHGMVDSLSPDRSDPARIALAPLEAAIDAGTLDYVALGDRHSTTDVGRTGRVWYSGTPETTDFDEEASGNVLVVAIGDAPGDRSTVRASRVGSWSFVRLQLPMNGRADIDALADRLNGMEGKASTVLKLALRGTLGIRDKAELDRELAHYADLFACLVGWERLDDLAVVPEDEDFSDLALTGFAAGALDELRSMASRPDPEGDRARDALALLVRLARGA